MTRLFSLLTLTTALFTHSVEASTCRGLDVLIDEMKLSHTQLQIHRDLSDVYKEKYRVTKAFHAERLTMIQQYMEGQIDRDGAFNIADHTHNERMDQEHEVQVTFIEILETLSADQQQQLHINLDRQEICFKQKMANKVQTRVPIGQILFDQLRLTDEQTSIIIEAWHERQASVTPMVYGLHYENILAEYLAGTLSDTAASSEFEAGSKDEAVFRRNQLDAMFDLLDSFDDVQRSQFIDNIRRVQEL